MARQPRTPKLRSRWLALLAGYGVPADRASVAFTALVAAYSEPHRHYHTLAHIERTLSTIDRLRHLAADPQAVELAAWLHDLVYDPTREDNERQSAEHAATLLRSLGLDPATIARVQTLILATKAHQAGDDPDAAVLIDADLASLAAPWDEFQADGQKIRQEYVHLSEGAFRAGRAAVLRSFLARPHLYQTAKMRQSCEDAARRNLARALAELE